MAFSGAQVTRLGLYGGTRGLYGSFAGKTEQEIADRGGGYPWPSRKQQRAYERWRKRRRKFDDDLQATLEAAYRAAVGEIQAEDIPAEDAAEIRQAANEAAPKSARRKRAMPEPAKVDYEKLARDARVVDLLLQIYERRRKDDEVAAILLLMQ